MANAQQPTRRTRHMDTKYFALQDWVEHDRIEVTQIGTANNIRDAFTKALGRIKFYEQTASLWADVSHHMFRTGSEKITQRQQSC
jgi:hypothetical protein